MSLLSPHSLQGSARAPVCSTVVRALLTLVPWMLVAMMLPNHQLASIAGAGDGVRVSDEGFDGLMGRWQVAGV